jgi:hypothetical protein
MKFRLTIVVVFLFASIALADEPQLSAPQTIDYIASQYKATSLHPELGFDLSYRPPLLRIMWQQRFPGIAPGTDLIANEAAEIDLRYASFDVWSDGRTNSNTVIVECVGNFPCYNDILHNQKHGNANLEYPILVYQSNKIAKALNHISSLHAAERPKDPFD